MLHFINKKVQELKPKEPNCYIPIFESFSDNQITPGFTGFFVLSRYNNCFGLAIEDTVYNNLKQKELFNLGFNFEYSENGFPSPVGSMIRIFHDSIKESVTFKIRYRDNLLFHFQFKNSCCIAINYFDKQIHLIDPSAPNIPSSKVRKRMDKDAIAAYSNHLKCCRTKLEELFKI